MSPMMWSMVTSHVLLAGEDGFVEVQALNSKQAMSAFVKRMLQEERGEVNDLGSWGRGAASRTSAAIVIRSPDVRNGENISRLSALCNVSLVAIRNILKSASLFVNSLMHH